MQKNTVIAKLRAEITFSEEIQDYFEELINGNDNLWFAKDGGNLFLAEFGKHWNNIFIQTTQEFYGSYFKELGISAENSPEVNLTDSRRGSWIMDAALIMFGSVGTTYTIFKGISELPKIADGIEETKLRLQKKLSKRFKKEVKERIEPILLNHSNISPQLLPLNSISINYSIDARPLRGLAPDKIFSHSIHLSIGISRSALTIENLSDNMLDNLRIGLFKSTSQRHNWSFADAYSKSVSLLSGKQTISLSVDEFQLEATKKKLTLMGSESLYIDCWVQDNSGIYLFNFFIE